MKGRVHSVLCNREYTDLINQQREFFNTGKTLDVDFRISALKRLKLEIQRQEMNIEHVLKKDLGKSKFETYLGEVGSILVEIDYHIKNLKKWVKPKRVKTPLFLRPSYSRIVCEPYGVSFIISPWNYPFQLAIMPLIAAISAGNTAIIKPSEHTPNTALLVKEIIDKCFASSFVAVVNGGVEETTSLLQERFDMIFFTGSTKVGKIIAESASKTLTPVILELGGKSPVIFDDKIAMKIALKRLLMAKITNSGQTCVAPDYVFLPEHRKAEFVKSFVAVLNKFFQNTNLEKIETYKSITRIVNKEHLNRLIKLLDGEKVLWGGKTFADELKIQPTIIDCGDVADYLYDNKEKTAILQEEIFGLLLPIITYQDIDDVIKYIKAGEKPLSLYLFSNDKDFRQKILSRVSFGGGCVNDSLIHLANHHLPFGGVGQSGQGNYHGKASFLAFSHQKSLLYSPSRIDFDFKYMPHTPLKLKILKHIFK